MRELIGGDRNVLGLLRSANSGDRRGPSTNYPLGVGLLYQATSDEKLALDLLELAKPKRRRLTHHAAVGVGLVYQGTCDPRAAELLLPLLESKEQGAACEALKLVDFDEGALAEFSPRWHELADGPGAARAFVLKHFIHTPPDPCAARM